jgi:hypothetical protein
MFCKRSVKREKKNEKQITAIKKKKIRINVRFRRRPGYYEIHAPIRIGKIYFVQL